MNTKNNTKNIPPVISAQNFNAWFGNAPVLKNISLEVHCHEILGIIGPSNSGKTTFLRAINKLNNLNTSYRQSGTLTLNNTDLSSLDDYLVRKKVGIIFAMPQPLPVSVFENIAYGPKMHGMRNAQNIARTVETAMKKAAIWDELKDRLHTPAFKLSGGQQQRLCIARTLAVEPDVILFDEPCSGLDPISTAKVEETMRELRAEYTQILVTNNTKQAARVTDRTAFFLMGELIEINDTGTIFTSPTNKRTDDYISGKFG